MPVQLDLVKMNMRTSSRTKWKTPPVMQMTSKAQKKYPKRRAQRHPQPRGRHHQKVARRTGKVADLQMFEVVALGTTMWVK